MEIWKLRVWLFGIWLLGASGWIANIVQIFNTMPETLSGVTPMFVAKAVCVFLPPIGSILGWVGMF